MTTNVTVVTGDPPRPVGMTYPRRARGLVRNGRAEWLDEQTILLRAGRSAPSVEGMEEQLMADQQPREAGAQAHSAQVSTAPDPSVPMSPEGWMAVFRGLVDRVINDEVALREAVAAIAKSCESGAADGDHPAAAIAEIYESHNRTRLAALKALADFVVVCGGDESRTTRTEVELRAKALESEKAMYEMVKAYAE